VALDGQSVPGRVAPALAENGIELVVPECAGDEDLTRHAADADVVWVFGGSRVVTAGNLGLLGRSGRPGASTNHIPCELPQVKRFCRIGWQAARGTVV
jgi:hypothetical protein